jgi:hypothetical protein
VVKPVVAQQDGVAMSVSSRFSIPFCTGRNKAGIGSSSVAVDRPARIA